MNARESENYLPISVFPKVENPCLTFDQASKKICLTEPKLAGPKNMTEIQEFSFCTMQHA
jgi:hypothetical protein